MRTVLALFSLSILIYPLTGGLENSARQPDKISNVSPSWSPDGTSIAFISDRSGNYDLWTMTSDGKNLTDLTEQNPYAEFSPKWSPDGNSIAYVVQSLSDQVFAYTLDIWLVRLNDGSRTNLTAPLTMAGRIGNAAPAWSPDGDQIVFSSSDTSSSHIVVFDRRDSTFATLAQNNDGLFDRPLWSPDGEWIAFVAYGDHPGLWVIAKNGENLREIITGEVRDFSWSPDGTRIVFSLILNSSFEDNDIDLKIINLNSSQVVGLTEDFPGVGVEAAWSPTGEQILFIGIVERVVDIWKINSDGTGLVNLTSDEARDGNATWSPDGSRIAFGSDRAGAVDIWVMNADGSNPVNLTGTRGDASIAWAGQSYCPYESHVFVLFSPLVVSQKI